MNIPVRLQPPNASPPEVEYRWDTDTDILTASMKAEREGDGISGSVEVEGRDGSWLMLDVSSGQIKGVEVAVWPQVQKRADLAPPANVEDATVEVGAPGSGKRVSALEVDTAVAAESDTAERTIHFRLGPQRRTRTVRIARDILLDIDGRDRIAGIWLLEVPPFPTPE